MKTINVFLASSEELKQERLELADLVEHLNHILMKHDIQVHLVKWEYLDSSMGIAHKQEEYNKALRECDICIVIYWNVFGQYTKQELDTAYNELIAGRNPHKIYVYFKDSSNASQELLEFRDSFPKQYGHFYCPFDNIDTLELNFLLQFMDYQSKELAQSLIEVRDSKVLLGGKEAVNLNNVPFAGNNEEYQQLLKTIERTRKYLSKLELNDPEYSETAQELQELLKKQQQMEHNLFETAILITRLSNQQCSERLERATQLFLSGDNKGANAILNEEQIEKDVEHNFQLVKLGEEGRKGLEININEYKLKIQTIENGFAKGWMEQVTQLRKRILEICQSLYGEQSAQTAEAYLDYANALAIQAHYKEALSYAEQALKIDLEILGEKHPDTATCYNDAGLIYIYLGEHQKALEYLEKALQIDLEVLGEKHQGTAVSYSNVGNEYGELGDRQKALKYFEKALQIDLEIFGEKHRDTAISFNNVGSEYGDLGDHQKALEYLEKALQIHIELGEDKHPKTAYCYNNIGLEYEALGDHQKALEYLEKALQTRLDMFGDKHPDTAQSYNNVGCEYGKLGDHQKALEYFEKALRIYLEIFGDNYPEVARSYNNIGGIHYELGDYQKALEYYEKALQIHFEVFGDRHPKTATLYDNIGASYRKLGNLRKGLKYNIKAFIICFQLWRRETR